MFLFYYPSKNESFLDLLSLKRIFITIKSIWILSTYWIYEEIYPILWGYLPSTNRIPWWRLFAYSQPNTPNSNNSTLSKEIQVYSYLSRRYILIIYVLGSFKIRHLRESAYLLVVQMIYTLGRRIHLQKKSHMLTIKSKLYKRYTYIVIYFKMIMTLSLFFL
jgi:hypothetical protein